MPQVDWTVLRATDGTRRARVHLAQVYIDLPELTLYGRFAQYPVSQNLPFHIILGRSFLQHAVMEYDGPNGPSSSLSETTWSGRFCRTGK